MSHRIDNLGPVQNTAAGKPTQRADGRAAATGGGSTEAVRATDAVALTREAQQLQQTVESLGNGQSVDQAKVEHLRRMVLDGSYQVDANRVADKLVDLEGKLNKP